MTGALPGAGHDDAARLGIRGVVRALISSVGAAVVQALTACPDPTLPERWTDGEAAPTPTQEAQLQLAYRVWRIIDETDGPSVALAWLVGANPRLGGATPVTAIRELRTVQVIGAAQAYADDSP